MALSGTAETAPFPSDRPYGTAEVAPFAISISLVLKHGTYNKGFAAWHW
jgi:hypothetical protein